MTQNPDGSFNFDLMTAGQTPEQVSRDNTVGTSSSVPSSTDFWTDARNMLTSFVNTGINAFGNYQDNKIQQQMQRENNQTNLALATLNSQQTGLASINAGNIMVVFLVIGAVILVVLLAKK